MECCLTIPDHIAPDFTKLELWETEDDTANVQALLKQNEILPEDRIVAICLASMMEVKRWPILNYTELIHRLCKKSCLKVVILAETVDQEDLVHDDDCIIDLRGKLTLRETVALLRHTKLFIGNDTGLMHIAAAVGCAVVEISCFARFGDVASTNSISSTVRFSPWSKEALIVQPVHQLEGCEGMCQMPYAHCITQVTVDAVLEAACKLLSGGEVVAGQQN